MSLTDLGLPSDSNGGGEVSHAFHARAMASRHRSSFTSSAGDSLDRLRVGGWAGVEASGSSRSLTESTTIIGRDQIPGVLPFLPSVNRQATDSDTVVPRRVAASLTSLSSFIYSESARARHFSPISRTRNRQSFSDSQTEYTGTRAIIATRQESLTQSQLFHPPETPSILEKSMQSVLPPPDGKGGSTTAYDSDGCSNSSSSVSEGPIRSTGPVGDTARRDGHENQGQMQTLLKHAARLRERRTVVSDLIKTLRDIRSNAERLRRTQAKADRAFLVAARVLLAGYPGLVEMLDAMQAARIEHQEADIRIDEVVEELDRAENDLDIQERIFYSVAAGATVPFAESDSDDSSVESTFRDVKPSRGPPNRLPYELTGISGVRSANEHPMLRQLYRATRDFQLTEEFIAELGTRKQMLESVVADLGSANLAELHRFVQESYDPMTLSALESKLSQALSKDDVEFLHRYSSLADTANQRRDNELNQVTRLTAECHRAGLLLEDEQGTDILLETAHPSTYLQDSGDGDDSYRTISLAHRVFPALLPNPASLLETEPKTPQQALVRAAQLPANDPSRSRKLAEARREHSIQNIIRGSNPGNKADWLNRWLLHKLHTSAMEAETLFAIARMHLDISDVAEWQKNVLRFWTRDSAAVSATSETNKTTINDSIRLLSQSSENQISRRRSESDLRPGTGREFSRTVAGH